VSALAIKRETRQRPVDGHRLSARPLSDEDSARLLQAGLADEGTCRATILGALADLGDQTARAKVVERAVAGDLEALSAMGDVTALDDTEAALLIAKFEDMTARTLEAARRNSWGFGGFAAGAALAVLNTHFPNEARWPSLIEFLAEQKVAADDKRAACMSIASLSDRLPQEVLDELIANIDTISVGTSTGLGPDIGGIGTLLAIAIGAIDGADADTAVARLAFGSEQQRQDSAMIIGAGRSPRMEAVLAALAADPQSSVRRASANAVGRLMAAGADSPIPAIAEALAGDGSVLIPSALLGGLSHGVPLARESLGCELAQRLTLHASARVRRLADRVLQT